MLTAPTTYAERARPVPDRLIGLDRVDQWERSLKNVLNYGGHFSKLQSFIM